MRCPATDIAPYHTYRPDREFTWFECTCSLQEPQGFHGHCASLLFRLQLRRGCHGFGRDVQVPPYHDLSLRVVEACGDILDADGFGVGVVERVPDGGRHGHTRRG